MAWQWTVRGRGAGCPGGVGLPAALSARGLCRLLRGRLPAGTERGRALAGSRQWRLGHPHLQPEMLQGGPGSDPPASGDAGWGGSAGRVPPGAISASLEQGWGACVGEGSVPEVLPGVGVWQRCQQWCHQCTVPSCSITAQCPPTTAPYQLSPSTPAPTTSSSPTRTSR